MFPSPFFPFLFDSKELGEGKKYIHTHLTHMTASHSDTNKLAAGNAWQGMVGQSRAGQGTGKLAMGTRRLRTYCRSIVL